MDPELDEIDRMMSEIDRLTRKEARLLEDAYKAGLNDGRFFEQGRSDQRWYASSEEYVKRTLAALESAEQPQQGER